MLRKEVERTPRCAMRARRYVVAWNGVLTLAYEGLPRPLVELKARLREASAALPAENPGSLWPKTTVAALRDDVRLTPAQLETLLEICEAMADDVQQENAFEVADLDLVVYECRSLEKRINQETIPLDGSQDVHDEVDAVEKSKVQRVVDEAKDPHYWFHASKDGSRASHYRSSAPGATLVHSLKSPPATLDEFQRRVEHAMPGMYTWFATHSLHITMRAILS